MTLEQARRWRTLAGKIAAVFIILMFVALFDGLVAKFRQPFNEYEVLPGDVVALTGPLPEDVALQDLTYSSNSENVQVSFLETHRGFWLGGAMWRAELRVSPQIPPGKYALTVRPGHMVSDQPPLRFDIVVYPDSLSMQQNSRSFIQRYAGESPWIVSGMFVALIGLTLVVIFYLARQLENLLAHRGQAEIYKVQRLEEGYAIAFGLGTGHGISPGDQVTVLDPKGNSVGTAQVEKCSTQDSVGFAALDQDIRPGFLVSRY